MLLVSDFNMGEDVFGLRRRSYGSMVRATIDGLMLDARFTGDARLTISDLVSEINELRKLNRRQELRLRDLSRDLQTAALFQKDFFPASIPQINGIELATLHRAADAVTGDFYDITRVDDSHVGFLLADATGHGYSAGLLAAFAYGAARRAISLSPLNPNRVLAAMNDEIVAAGLSECQFVTAIYAVFDEVRRELIWARAGAPYPVVVDGDGTVKAMSGEGPMLGVAPAGEPDFEVSVCHVSPGTGILLHTDGIESLLRMTTELLRSSKTGFDAGRFLEAIASQAIGGDDPQCDDVTILALQAA